MAKKPPRYEQHGLTKIGPGTYQDKAGNKISERQLRIMSSPKNLKVDVLVTPKIEQVRKQKGMMRTHLALALGTSDTLIRYYELGKVSPTAGQIAKMMIVLGVSFEELFEIEVCEYV